MNKTIKILIVVITLIVLAFLITVGVKTFSHEDAKLGSPGSICQQDSECQTPMEFLIQSNCPFGSACIENSCAVVCPVFESSCSEDEDCDCSQRGNRSLGCLCHDGACISIEEN